jgi:hypothetical protein
MSDLTLWINPDYWGGAPYYNHAFVGPPSLTATELFSQPGPGVATLVALPEAATARVLAPEN